MTDVQRLLRQLSLEPFFTLGVIADAYHDAGEDALEAAYRYLIDKQKHPLVKRPGGMKNPAVFIWKKNGNGSGSYALYEDRFPGLRVMRQDGVLRRQVPVTYPTLADAYEAAARAYRPPAKEKR